MGLTRGPTGWRWRYEVGTGSTEKSSGLYRELRRRAAKGHSEISEFRRLFWALYAQLYPKDAVKAGLRPGYARSNTWYKTAHPGVIVSQYLAKREVGIYCTSPWGAPAEEIFPNLEGYEEPMRAELGVEVGEAADVYGAVKSWRVETRDRGNWESMAGWLHRQLETYLEVIDRGPSESG